MQFEENKRYLNEAIEALDKMKLLTEQRNDLKVKENECRSLIDAKKKELNQKIETTIKQRLSDIENTYAKELDTLNSNKKSVNQRRDKAKSKGIKDRIQVETKDLKNDISDIKKNIKEKVKENKIPLICRNKWFYTIYMPNKIIDFVYVIIAFLVCFSFIPALAYKFVDMPVASWIKIMIIYTIDIIIFGGIYIFVMNKTKVKHRDDLKEIRTMFNNIRLKTKEIKKKTKEIKNDKDENKYDLANFDSELATIMSNIDIVNNKRNEAISTFENITKGIITEELTESVKEELNNYDTQLKSLSENLKSKEEDLRNINLLISDKFETKLGRDCLDKEKINKLIDILDEDNSLSITQAIDKLKSN